MRHLTEVGYDAFVLEFEAALTRLKPSTGSSGKQADGENKDFKDLARGSDEQVDLGGGSAVGGKSKRKRKKKKQDVAMGVGTVAAPELDDEWADSVRLDAVAPSQSSLRRGSNKEKAALPLAPAATRVLRTRNSGSRSPPPSRTVMIAPPASDAEGITVGSGAMIGALQSRPELSSAKVHIVSCDATAGRFGCRMLNGDTISIKAENLMLLRGVFADAARESFGL